MRSWLLIAAALALLTGPTPGRAEVRRFAVVAGNNVGQRHEAVLRYAEDDAERFADVLRELGSFPAGNVRVLKGQDPDAFLAAVRDAEAALSSPAATDAGPSLLLLYFSGHADGTHLHFGDQRLPFARLKQVAERSQASIRLAIVDACQSGGMTRTKGFRFGAAYDLNLVDQLEASGTAVLTSSADGEVSQESDELGGSYFTYYLTAGLRGAADEDGDERVSLAEVYRYAATRTAVETARTLGEIGDRRAVHPLLETLRQTQDAKVLSASSDALAQLGELAAIYEILPRMRATRNPVLKRSLAVAVGDLLGQRDEFYKILVREQETHASEAMRLLKNIRRQIRARLSPELQIHGEALAVKSGEIEAAYEDRDVGTCAHLLFDLAIGLAALRHGVRFGGNSEVFVEELIWRDQRFGVGVWFLHMLCEGLAEDRPATEAPDLVDILLGIYFLAGVRFEE